MKHKFLPQSMSRKGNSLDNGLMECFFGLLKSEMFYEQEEKGRYINLLSSENVKELTKWGLELQEKEKERVKKFFNKEKDN